MIKGFWIYPEEKKNLLNTIEKFDLHSDDEYALGLIIIAATFTFSFGKKCIEKICCAKNFRLVKN